MQPLLQWKIMCITQRMCVCSLRNPACAYCHLWPSSLYNIFPHYLINGTFLKKIIRHKHVFRVSLQLSSEVFFILTRPERDIIRNVFCFSCKVTFILVRF